MKTASFFNVSYSTVCKYIKSKKLFKGKYYFVKDKKDDVVQ